MLLHPWDDEDTDTVYDSLVLRWSHQQGVFVDVLNFVGVSIIEFHDEIVVLGRLGAIGVLNDPAATASIAGPEDVGFLSDMRAIDNSIYAVGMWRQAYVSTDGRQWRRFDEGVRDEVRARWCATGFRAIDGRSTGQIFAVGRAGEIWRADSQGWSPEESPTNVILEQVRVGEDGVAYAAGQSGVLLRGSGDRWSVIEQTVTDEDIWGLELFRGHVYFSSPSSVYKMNPHGGIASVFITDGSVEWSRMRAGRGALWALGQERAFWTDDGERWHEAVFRRQTEL